MAKRKSWLDDKTNEPLIDQYAQQLGAFVDAMADGRIEAAEVDKQEERLTALMKEVEPQLDDATHEKVTRLLCELSAYNLMQFLHTIHAARPATRLNL
jgi:hypothetical protein